jgi:hypothetical protein
MELMVDVLPLSPVCERFGDSRPEFREPGRNSAVAGEAVVFPEVPWLEPLPDVGLLNLSWPVEGLEGSGGTRDELDPVAAELGASPFC